MTELKPLPDPREIGKLSTAELLNVLRGAIIAVRTCAEDIEIKLTDVAATQKRLNDLLIELKALMTDGSEIGEAIYDLRKYNVKMEQCIVGLASKLSKDVEITPSRASAQFTTNRTYKLNAAKERLRDIAAANRLMPAAEIADRLNKEGHRTVHGKLWTNIAVNQQLWLMGLKRPRGKYANVPPVS